MAQIASEALVQRLIDWGIDTVLVLPGERTGLTAGIPSA
jgi:hypothetical protein